MTILPGYVKGYGKGLKFPDKSGGFLAEGA